MRIVHICFDHLFPWSKDDACYKENRKRMLDLVESSIISSQEKTLIIIDDNNYYQSMRYKQIQLCRKLGVSFGILYFPLTLEECLVRNRNRLEGRLPEDVIKRMFSSLETPLRCFLYEQGTRIESLVHYLEEKFQNPLEPSTDLKESIPMTQSQIHVYDLHLRKLVSERMKLVEIDKKVVAEKLNNKRKKILENLKSLEVSMESLDDLTLIFES